MASYAAKELIAAAKAYITAEAAIMTKRPAGIPRAAWRGENKGRLPVTDFDVCDGRAKRRLSFDANGNPYDLWVWSAGARPRVIERIDLRSAEAEQKLAKYERL